MIIDSDIFIIMICQKTLYPFLVLFFRYLAFFVKSVILSLQSIIFHIYFNQNNSKWREYGYKNGVKLACKTFLVSIFASEESPMLLG